MRPDRSLGRQRVPLVVLLISAVTFGCTDASEAPVATSASAVTTVPAQTSGYGDFSGVEFYDVDAEDVIARIQRCLHDNGFPVAMFESGDGLDFSGLPPDQSQAAVNVLQQCEEGLSLPAPRPPTVTEAEMILDRLLEVRDCLEGQGYAIGEPPSVEAFAESYMTGPWHPYLSLRSLPPDDRRAAEAACPQP